MAKYLVEYTEKCSSGKYSGTFTFEAEDNEKAILKMQELTDHIPKRTAKKLFKIAEEVWEGRYYAKEEKEKKKNRMGRYVEYHETSSCKTRLVGNICPKCQALLDITSSARYK